MANHTWRADRWLHQTSRTVTVFRTEPNQQWFDRYICDFLLRSAGATPSRSNEVGAATRDGATDRKSRMFCSGEFPLHLECVKHVPVAQLRMTRTKVSTSCRNSTTSHLVQPRARYLTVSHHRTGLYLANSPFPLLAGITDILFTAAMTKEETDERSNYSNS